MNRKVRQACVERSGDACEACGRYVNAETGHLDHAFGRGKAEETVATCWFLCLPCDVRKTANQPNAVWWLTAFALHALKHGYLPEANRALGKTLNLAVKGLAA